MLLDAISIVVLLVDRDGIIRSSNAAAHHMLAYSSQALVGQSLAVVLPSLADGRCIGTFLLERATSKGSIELKARSRLGRSVPVGVRCAGPIDDNQFVLSLRDLSERKRAQARGRAQRQYLRRVIEATGDAIVTLDEQSRIVLFSPKAEEMFGHSAAELVGEPFQRLLPNTSQVPGDGLGILAKLRAAESLSAKREFLCHRHDGRSFPVEASIACFRYNGRPHAILALRDLSGTREAERHARARERLFKAVFDQGLHHLAILRPDGAILEMNASMKRLLGDRRVSVDGLLFWQASWFRSHEPTLHKMKAAIEQAAKGEIARVEFTLPLSNSGLRTFDFSAHPIHCEDEGVSLIVVVGRDITNRIHTEGALRESERRLANAQRIAGLGHWDWNLATGELFWSNEIFRIFGRDPSDFCATYAAFLDCVHPDDRSRVDFGVRRAIHLRNEYRDDYRIVHPDGSIRFIHEQGEVVRDETGQPVAVTGVVQDVTEAKDIEKSLRSAKLKAEAASEAKSAFLANMSHELRTPLNAILGFSEIMMNEMFGRISPERYRSYPREIHDSGRHLLAIVNDILDMAKIEHGKLALQEQTIELSEIVDYCARLMSGAAITAGIELTSECQPGLPPVRVDPLLLRRVVLNLISNSIKFTAPGGSVRITGGLAPDGSIIVRVSDNGVGMALADIPKALEPFGQIESAMRRRHGGTGLGLPLSKSLVEMHGGRLEIETALGSGTVVSIFLPASRLLMIRYA